MTINIRYTGGANVRKISQAQFESVGVFGQVDAQWDRTNNFVVPVTDPAGLFLMAQAGEFEDVPDQSYNTYVGGSGKMEWVFELAAGVASVALGSEGFTVPYPVTLIRVITTCQVAPVGAALVCNLRADTGSGANSVFTGKPTIAAGQKVSNSVTPAITPFPAGTTFYRDIDQVGTTTPGSGVYMHVQFNG